MLVVFAFLKQLELCVELKATDHTQISRASYVWHTLRFYWLCVCVCTKGEGRERGGGGGGMGERERERKRVGGRETEKQSQRSVRWQN